MKQDKNYNSYKQKNKQSTNNQNNKSDYINVQNQNPLEYLEPSEDIHYSNSSYNQVN